MKRRILNAVFALAVMAVAACGSYKKSVQYSCDYVRAEDFYEKDFWLTSASRERDEAIVNSPESAAMLAYVYVLNLYGEAAAKGEQPYRIRLVNDSIWCVTGDSRTYNKKVWKGNFTIAIDKRTGTLISYLHEK